jgi:hypothetical protein
MPLNILDIVQSRSQRVVDIDNDNLPVGLSFIQQGHDTENLDLLDLSNLADSFTDFTDVQRVVVTVCLGFRVGNGRVFPGLREGSVVPDLAGPEGC